MKKIISAFLVIFFVTGCQHKPPVESNSDEINETTIIQNESEQYKTITPQPSSPSRGATQKTASTSFDLDYMENDLMELSKNYVDPGKYIYQPGQIITEEDVYSLLAREYTTDQYENLLKEDPDAINIGLNPSLDDGENPEDKKLYASTLIEQNYGEIIDGEYVIDTVSIGIGIPSEYQIDYEDEDSEIMIISQEEIVEYAAKEITNRIIFYTRDYKQLDDINILVGFYYETEQSFVPGTYVSSSYIEAGSDEVTNYEEYDQEYVLYPSEEGDKIDATLNQQMTSVNNKLTNYFDDYSGFYAQAKYEDGILQSIEMKVSINLYSSIDGISFTNYVEETVLTEIETNVPIDIQIRDTNFEAVALILIENGQTKDKYIY